MARKRNLLLTRLSTVLRKHKHTFVGLTLLIVLNQPGVILANKPDLEQTAQNLNLQGVVQLHQGQAQAALKSWQSAYRTYQKLNNHQGMVGSLINQSLALQATGSYNIACHTLVQALNLEYWICPTSAGQRQPEDYSVDRLNKLLQKQPAQNLQIFGLYNLGNVLRLMGELDASSVILQKALSISQTISGNTQMFNQISLSIANTDFALYKRARNQFSLIDEPVAKEKALNLAVSKIKSALLTYEKFSFKEDEWALQAKLNEFKLLIEAASLPNYSPSEFSHNSDILNLIENILTRFSNVQNMPIINYIDYRLNFAYSLIEYADNNSRDFKKNVKDNLLSTALLITQNALVQSRSLNNNRTISNALGILGYGYSSINQLNDAETYFKQAIALAQSVQAWDLAYQWQWQLGKLYKTMTNNSIAIQTYKEAIKSLNQIRGNILSANPDIQFAFKTKIEPVYKQYMELVLSQEDADVSQVIKAQEQLNMVELENYLQCGKLSTTSLLDSQNVRNQPPSIYLIRLINQVEVIIRDQQGKFHRHSVNIKLLDSLLDELISLSQTERFKYFSENDLLPYCQEIYHLLLSPLKQYLPSTGHLIFVLDSYFQNLPIPILHDGENYLIKKYSISLSSTFQFYKKQDFKQDDLKALVAAIYQLNPKFSQKFTPLPEVKAEIQNIRENTASTLELINSEFTIAHFQQKIKQPPSIVHISSHSQFSSDPEQTFILAWDSLLTLNQLDYMFQRQNPESLINLLVLSACQTAKSDRRSALGIAGLAVQSGARSTIASLWLVNSDSTTYLMGKFYQGLKSGLSKGEALRQAQLSLLSHPKYSHPYYWAAFMLIGAWD
ncbi:CHAT domain-containing protein [Anabaena azotica]|uniref:CHAT domain-containing protein n=1 Tax=Anabaena azotica FACHB-119 TaxID=947527 RepID=A0ABR8DDL3_9NOST|nr:CHAT domain-containing protein [Anabaena azotica]MBD2505017.1 CHAT domain-containing protein [Anabaena azotica FACHB-119]